MGGYAFAYTLIFFCLNTWVNSGWISWLEPWSWICFPIVQPASTKAPQPPSHGLHPLWDFLVRWPVYGMWLGLQKWQSLIFFPLSFVWTPRGVSLCIWARIPRRHAPGALGTAPSTCGPWRPAPPGALAKARRRRIWKKHLVSKPSSAMTSSHAASLNPTCRNGFNCTSGHPLSTGVRLRSDKEAQVTRGAKHGPESRVGMCTQLRLQSPLDFPLHWPFRGWRVRKATPGALLRQTWGALLPNTELRVCPCEFPRQGPSSL